MLDISNRDRLESLFDTYYSKVYSFLYVKVRNTQMAEDLTSQAFLKVAEKLHTYNEKKGSISTWIFTIALNEMRSCYRSKKGVSFVDLEDISILQADQDIEQDVIDNEEKKTLYSIIASLGEREQTIILLKYYGDMSNKEIASSLGISETNTSTILSRMIKKMKNMCDEIEKSAYKGIGGVNYER